MDHDNVDTVGVPDASSSGGFGIFSKLFFFGAIVAIVALYIARSQKKSRDDAMMEKFPA